MNGQAILDRLEQLQENCAVCSVTHPKFWITREDLDAAIDDIRKLVAEPCVGCGHDIGECVPNCPLHGSNLEETDAK